MRNPYLSVVVTSRNDDHGGDLLKRMQIFINGLLTQCERHQLEAELILVEWNPPLDRPRLQEVLDFSAGHSFCSVRIIEVPNEIHQTFNHADNLPLFQMIAKNVGIRRARGQFILATNIDILFSEELINFICLKKFKSGYYYRVDRYDVDQDIPLSIPLKEQLNYCENNILRINERNGTLIYATKEYQPIYLFFYKLFIPRIIRVALWKILNKLKIRSSWSKHLWSYKPYPFLHTNACGDFTLMSKDDWCKLQGYPEFEMYSLHIDSLLCFMAYYSGIKEFVLPSRMRIYHIEHRGGWTPESDKEGILDRHLQSAKVNRLSIEEFDAIVMDMFHKKRSKTFNTEQWGLVNQEFSEILI